MTCIKTMLMVNITSELSGLYITCLSKHVHRASSFITTLIIIIRACYSILSLNLWDRIMSSELLLLCKYYSYLL